MYLFPIMWLRPVCTAILFIMVACEAEPEPQYASVEELMDPQTCAECHPDHLAEWAGSMHAYAAEDPVFLAMNARGQRETGGELGDFCVKCHAPIAVRLGTTTDGLNLADLPSYQKGVTCYACHAVSSVEGTHNNPLVLAADQIMRGGFGGAAENPIHGSAYSNLHDRDHLASADMCGSCHDIVNSKGAHIERTFKEWKESLFADPSNPDRSTCNRCHLPGRTDVVADYEGVSLRRHHDHKMVGVDVALADFPDREAQRAAIQRALNTTLQAKLCVGLGVGERISMVVLENLGAGHHWPSGAAQDRRAWVELKGYVGDELVYTSGVVADDEVLMGRPDDEELWTFGDQVFDADDHHVHMHWEIERITSSSLPAHGPHQGRERPELHRTRLFGMPDVDYSRVTMRVRIRPMGLDILQSLVDSNDLDAVYLSRMPTFDLGSTVLEWTPEAQDAEGCVPAAPG